MAVIENNISFFIQSHFPSIYRENGEELVELVTEYYKWMENTDNQSIYNARRMFEYRDIDNTLEKMLIFFQKKFLADLPLKQDTVRFITKNILDLYRRKGTPAGIELFFALFYNEFDAEITYPARFMFKASNSNWKNGIYLQMFPNKNKFLSKTDKEYSYKDLLSRNILGSSSGAVAAVDKINFVILNNILTPIIYIDAVLGTFVKYDDLITVIDGEEISFGRIAGSLSAVEVDTTNQLATTGHEIGEVYNISTTTGKGGEVMVTEVSNELSGEINYQIEDGGFGYTIENTRLMVSNQSVLFNQTEFDANEDDLTFTAFERVRDFAGNEGIVIGQQNNVLGLQMNAGDEFSINRILRTVDRPVGENVIIQPSWVGLITPKNDTSPGDMFVDTGLETDVKVLSLDNATNVNIITDPIAPHLATVLNIADYEVNAPFSGTASPVNLSTPLDQAFDISTLTIGSIREFKNLNPGSLYTFDLFARARDDVFSSLQRRPQIISFADPAQAGVFDVNTIIEETNTGRTGIITKIDTQKGFIGIIPYDYYGFSAENEIVRANGNVPIAQAGDDLTEEVLGLNANIEAETEFSVGKISKVAVIDSGFGYNTGQLGNIFDDDNAIKAVGTVFAETQGSTSGYWSEFSSHLNGYQDLPVDADTPILPTVKLIGQLNTLIANTDPTTPPEVGLWMDTIHSDGYAYLDLTLNGAIDNFDVIQLQKIFDGASDVEQDAIDRWNNVVAPSMKEQIWFRTYPEYYQYLPEQTYYTSSMKIQDSDFYQEYSYQIKSTLAKQEYEKLLKENVHLAGTKMFGDFIFKARAGSASKMRFRRNFNTPGPTYNNAGQIDDGAPPGSLPILIDSPDLSTLTVDVQNLRVDRNDVLVDNDSTV
tara:strand:+ start:7303 stop:9942 length:2640 start_codon:yes stop_codon:yes gene_type:complete